MQNLPTFRGFTLVELLVAMSVAMIIATLGVPSMQRFIERNRLKTATEKIVGDLKYARSEAIKQNSEIFVSIQQGGTWCLGIDDTATCDCTTSNDCQVNGTEVVRSGLDFGVVSLSHAGGDFTTGGTSFDPRRGTATDTGTIVLSTSHYSVNVGVNTVGRLSICSTNVVGYNGC
jgi:type IV fimbrial biogenesis protein FimT